MTRPRVIVTRPEPDALAFARDAAAAGLAPIVSPVLEIVNRRARIDLQGVGAVAFTSANGVRAFASAAPDTRSLPVFAVGELTASAASAAGFSAIGAAEGDVASLAAKIGLAVKERAFAGAVLHISGSDRSGDLVGCLERQGISARHAVLYDAMPIRSMAGQAEEALRATPPAEWVALFSPRSAQVFLEQARAAKVVHRLAGVRAACLSPAVAEAAGAARFAAVEIAGSRSGAAVLALMTRFQAAARP